MAEVDVIYRTETAMQRLGIGRSFLYELIADKRLASFKVGRARMIRESACVAFLNKSEAASA